MTELQETLDILYKCKTEEYFDGDQIVIRDIVYVKNATEFIKFAIEERCIDNLSAMVRIPIDGSQNFLKVLLPIYEDYGDIYEDSGDIYEDSGDIVSCYILAIEEMVSEDNSNLRKFLGPLT